MNTNFIEQTGILSTVKRPSMISVGETAYHKYNSFIVIYFDPHDCFFKLKPILTSPILGQIMKRRLSYK